jgi:hypothetical protein
VPAGDPVHVDGREVGQNEEELEGNRFHLLPWSGTARGGGSSALGSGRRWWLGWWRSGAQEAEGDGCGGARKGEALPAPIYRRGKCGSRRYFELRGAPMAGNGGSGKFPSWTLVGGILGRFGAV